MMAPSPALGQQNPGLSLTAAEFLERVNLAHPRLALLVAAVDEATANVTSAGLWVNPALSYDREEIFANGRGQPENFLRLELPLEISGRRGLKVEASKQGLAAARKTAERGRLELLLDAEALYWRAAAARQTVALLETERDALLRIGTAISARTAAGDTSGYDLDRLEVEREFLEDLVADARRTEGALQLRLGLLLGPPRSRVEAKDALTMPSAPASLNTLLERALTSRADYQAARLRVTQAEAELSAARRGWVPGLVVTGGMRNAQFTNDTTWGYVAGVSLGLPVFDHGQAEAQGAAARLARAEASHRLLELEVEVEAITASEQLTGLLEQEARLERTQAPRIERLLRRAELSWREGERPIFELLDAYRTARTVGLHHVEIEQRARLAHLELARALGLAAGDLR